MRSFSEHYEKQPPSSLASAYSDATESQWLLSTESRSTEEKTLVWMDIEATVPMIGKSAKARRKSVLRKVSGVALPREVLAIMGSSGAGKTTLMNILAFQSSKEVECNGVVMLNGKPMTKHEMRSISAYVQQIDLFCGTLTVKEQLTYSALLRMGSEHSYKEKMEKVEEVIKDMNLGECKNSLIGIPNRRKGISVGEKKRLAFASEILTDPAILFCDEPTSGLDAFMAHQVVTALRIMSEKGKTVVTVIHQPGSQIFNMFDRVCFMALGKTAFHGTVKDLIKFFASLGDPTLRVPESYNPADHVIAKLSVSEDTSDEDEERVQYITEKFHDSITGAELRHLIEVGSTKLESNEDEETEKHRGNYPASIFVQMNVLFRRAFLTTIRDPVLLQVRILQVVITSVAIGIVNFQTEVYGPSIQNLEGVMYNCVRDMSFLFFYPSINVITSELPVFLRESKARIYSPEAYFISKSLAEMPQYIVLPLIYSAILYWMTGLAPTARQFIIFSLANVFQSLNAISIGYASGCVFGDEGLAITAMSGFMQAMLVFGGFYINIHNIPMWMRPFSALSFFKYSFEALQINQWEDVTYIRGCTGLLSTGNNTVYCPSETGKGLLRKRGMEGPLILNILLLIFFIVMYRVIGLIALILRTRFS
ncbi:hypothetical protein RB195_020343 [Necator americanus]|uniref:ABC transporter domain-containing protein n=2 Tax=Necator americanus TaxID=51031 RepID=A0ABR1CLX5_NECAM